jgi:general secretion pathway protein I
MKGSKMDVDRGREGFTLLETLIAFMILSAAMAISAQTIAIAAKAHQGARERVEVLEVVDMLRAEALPEALRSGKGAHGMNGSHRWKIELVPIRRTDGQDGQAAFAVVSVSTSWGGEQDFIHFGTIGGLVR